MWELVLILLAIVMSVDHGLSFVISRYSICEEMKKQSGCDALHFDIDTLSSDSFTLLDKHDVDKDSSIQRIVVHITGTMSDADVLLIGPAIDTFLTPRPWFTVVQEPFSWRNKNESEIVFQRTLEIYEPFLKALSLKQYPSIEMCSQSPMLIGRRNFNHPGWFSVLAMYSMAQMEFPYAITQVWYSELPAESSIPKQVFMTDSDCPRINKWECAFLPATNCTVPSVVTECRDKDCGWETTNTRFSLLVDKADASGRAVEEKDKDTFSQVSMVVKDKINYVAEWFWFSFLLRQGSFYRSRVAELIDHFYKVTAAQTDVTSSSRFVAAHIRRGDRSVTSNASEYCLNLTQGLQCKDTPDGPLGYCNPDKGCAFGVPFAAITLSHVVAKVEALVGSDVKNIIVLSDDVEWVQNEIAALKATYPEFTILTMVGPSDMRMQQQEMRRSLNFNFKGHIGYRQIKGAFTPTDAGVYLFASLELVRNCAGFIGHMGSGVGQLFHRYVCHHQGSCPPIYNFQSGL